MGFYRAARPSKDSSRTNLADLGGTARANLVVPIAVEFVAVDIDAFKFLIGDFDARLIGFRVEFGMNLQAGGGSSGDEAHDGLETAQWLAAPVLTDHSAWYRDRVESWKDCSSIDDDALLQMIRADKIDILVDLAGHFPENKQQVLARRAAPIQIAHPVFPSTRGNPSIDYIITDQWTLPKELEPYLTEEPLRLPGGCMAFAPPPESPNVTHLPAIKNGFITFGLFQRRNKLNQRTLDLAGAVLIACPESALLIHHGDPELEEEDSPSQISLLDEFQRRGIAGSRLKFLGALPRNLAMAAMAQTDIALDSTPFCGHTTTSECLWMGIPVVTLAGDFYQSRVSTGMLHQIGLGHLSALTEQEYVAAAVCLASDLPALSQLRATMRTRIECSPFIGGPRLAGELENAYRQAWRQACLSNSQSKEQKHTDANKSEL